MIYDFLESQDNKTLFTYIAISLMIFFIFTKIDVKLSIIFPIGIIFIIISYMNDKKNKSIEKKEKEDKTKYDAIEPKSEILKSYDDIIDFIFSVQDFYIFNPMAYTEFVENLELFIKLKENMLTGVKKCDQYYTIAETKAQNSLNAFHSLIYRLPDDKFITEKFNRAHVRLNTILTHYLNQMYDECNNKIINYGLDITTKLINTGPKEANYYNNKDFSYEFY
jgi:hypothetical protein